MKHRLLAALNTITDNYPAPSTTVPNLISLDTFSLLIYPPVNTTAFSGQPVSLSMNGTISSGPDRDTQTSLASIVIPSTLFHGLSVPPGTHLVCVAFTSDSLFSVRQKYIESENRSSHHVGSAVLSARVTNGVKVVGLMDPVVLNFRKDQVSERSLNYALHITSEPSTV